MLLSAAYTGGKHFFFFAFRLATVEMRSCRAINFNAELQMSVTFIYASYIFVVIIIVIVDE